jgi:hypothetical protein
MKIRTEWLAPILALGLAGCTQQQANSNAREAGRETREAGREVKEDAKSVAREAGKASH